MDRSDITKYRKDTADDIISSDHDLKTTYIKDNFKPKS